MKIKNIWRAARSAISVTTLLLGSNASAAPVPVTNLATADNGLSVISASADVAATSVIIDARVNRSREARVVAPQRLRFAVIGADGIARASEERFIGPAQLSRRNNRQTQVRVTLATALQPTDRVVVEWAASAAR